MLVLTLRAPNNANAFSFRSAFFSAEYPEFVCSMFNDQLIVLVDTPSPSANPAHKNLMTYTLNGQPWHVNAQAANGTGLFNSCKPNGGLSDYCWDDSVSTQSCSSGEGLLKGTGFDSATPSDCNIGGGTGWLTTKGNVVPGEIVQIRIALWDVGDDAVDSLVLLDGFQWLQNPVAPGTTN
jgi:hypothetical protein